MGSQQTLNGGEELPCTRANCKPGTTVGRKGGRKKRGLSEQLVEHRKKEKHISGEGEISVVSVPRGCSMLGRRGLIITRRITRKELKEGFPKKVSRR